MTGQWTVLSASVRGAAHIRLDKPNEDAVRVYQGAGGLPVVLAVADGHGGERYFRSGIGAKLAADAAVEVLEQSIRSIEGSYQIAKDNIEITIPRAFVSHWRDAVSAHLSENPYTDDELTPENMAAIEKNEWSAYGATLICAVILDSRVILWQLGDGDVLAITSDNELFVPLEKDERLFANETTSLCLPDAVNEFRVFMRTYHEPLALLMLSTDGYSNSFRSKEGFWKVAPDLLSMIEEYGAEEVRRGLEEWLTDTSKEGSGDDITVAIACSRTPPS